MPLNLVHMLPVFQIEFGQSATLPYVSAAKFVLNSDLLNSDLLPLIDCAYGSKVFYKASLKQK